jgi:ribosomal protein L11 methyltransferase
MDASVSRTGYQPFVVGTRLRIVTPGTPASSDDRIDIVMARGAFGSGEHETTASCIEEIERLSDLSRASVLDVGSGTGILAIVCLRLAAARAVCVDIDPKAVESARLNALHNGLSDRVEHICGVLEDVGECGFDVVLANLYGDIVLEISEGLVERTRGGGTLVLSGVAWEYNFDVRRRFERLGCRVLRNRMLDEYSTLVLAKP